ncbi:MAG TPA: c-type cytochrome [Steroidobacteraceae bacterium]|nr:c-type cytochrome [Steroidobacteraceae bacterium]
MRRFIAALVLALTAMSAYSAEYTALSGKELYRKFCASCHGQSARGDGPIAASLKKTPADLTLIWSRYGQFPEKRIEEIVDGRVAVDAHGPSAMPVWGEEFTRSQAGDADAEKDAQTVIRKIVEYIRTLQRMK